LSPTPANSSDMAIALSLYSQNSSIPTSYSQNALATKRMNEIPP
jgi:hypothetical protein